METLSGIFVPIPCDNDLVHREDSPEIAHCLPLIPWLHKHRREKFSHKSENVCSSSFHNSSNKSSLESMCIMVGLPSWLSSKESAGNAGDAGDAGDADLIPGWGRSPGGGNGNPLQCSCLENPMDREAWRAAVHGVTRVRLNFSTKPRPPL